MNLTNAEIATLKCPPGKVEALFCDERLPGFALRITADGQRYWLVRYRIGGKRRKISLGSPDKGVKASTAYNAAAKLLARAQLARAGDGVDPATAKATAKQEARRSAAETISALLPDYLAEKEKEQKPRSFLETKRHLLKHAKPLHGESVADVDVRKAAGLFNKIAAKSGASTANRVRSSLGAFFTWAMAQGLLLHGNPVLATAKKAESKSRDRVLSADELRMIWHALDTPDPERPDAMHDDYPVIIKLLMLTGARRDEIAGLRRAEIKFEKALIELPGERTKNGLPHLIPLSMPALAILRAVPKQGDRDFMFGRNGGGFTDYSGNRKELQRRLGNTVTKWTPHDFRRTLSTNLHERPFSIPPHVVEAILGHIDGYKGGVAGVYNKALYLAERRDALKQWGAHVMRTVGGSTAVRKSKKPTTTNVITMPTRSRRKVAA